jgi:nucleoid DNA-binding protein
MTMLRNSTSEHELEQMRVALAQTLFEDVGLNLREALELADQFYAGIATSLESGDGVALADLGYFSLRDGFSSSNMYGSGRY